MPDAAIAGWTDERVETLKASWLDGNSASQVARQLGGGVSRNAVISKLHRLGLTGERSPVRRTAGSSQTRVRSQKIAAPKKTYGKAEDERDHSARAKRIQAAVDGDLPPLMEPIVAGKYPATASAKTLLQLGRHDCRFPVGDETGAEQLHCGAQTGGGVYCPGHGEIAGAGYGKELERGRTATRPGRLPSWVES